MKEFELFLMRHGVAEEWSPEGDRERSLSEEGKARIIQAARGISTLGFKPEEVLVSPYLRARQTCRLVLDGVGLELEPELCSDLIPAATPAETVQRLLSSTAGQVAVFGHNPNITAVVSKLVAGHDVSFFNIRPGTLIHLQIMEPFPFARGPQTPSAVVLGVYPSEVLETIGRGIAQ